MQCNHLNQTLWTEVPILFCSAMSIVPFSRYFHSLFFFTSLAILPEAKLHVDSTFFFCAMSTTFVKLNFYLNQAGVIVTMGCIVLYWTSILFWGIHFCVMWFCMPSFSELFTEVYVWSVNANCQLNGRMWYQTTFYNENYRYSTCIS